MKKIWNKMSKKQKMITAVILGLLLIASLLYDHYQQKQIPQEKVQGSSPWAQAAPAQSQAEISPNHVPDYSGNPWVVLNGNRPQFTQQELVSTSYERYSPLDRLGRCGVAEACIGTDLKPTDKRGEIGHIYPSGWKQNFYDFVDGQALYNRCHLIGFQLTGENDNERNLITGTRYMNTQGMLPFENMVADYLKEYPQNHVMYRVTPVYTGNNLVADGVWMEAWSVEDDGEGICFFVYVYNVQPGVLIDYATGENQAQ